MVVSRINLAKMVRYAICKLVYGAVGMNETFKWKQQTR